MCCIAYAYCLYEKGSTLLLNFSVICLTPFDDIWYYFRQVFPCIKVLRGACESHWRPKKLQGSIAYSRLLKAEN